MQKTIYLIALILSFNFCQSQIQSYKFTPENTKANLDPYYKSGYYIYQTEKKEVAIPIYDTVEKPSEAYKIMEGKLQQNIQDSIAYITKYNKNKEINKISENISDFFGSDSKMKTKKYFLINAQKIADKYDLPYLLYADKEFNKNKLKEFKDVSDLSDHLINIMTDITAKYEVDENKSILQNLKSTRLYLKNNNKTEKKLEVIDSVKSYILVQGERLKDFENISGTFDDLGEYTLFREDKLFGLKKMLKGQLVDSDSLKVITGDKNVQGFTYSYILIKNRDKEEYYTTSYDFLREFGINNKIDDYMNLLKNNGFTSNLNGDIMYINTNKGKVRATYDIYEEVQKGNFNYINQVANSMIEFKRIISQQANPLSDKLANHFSAHRSGTMSASRLNTWKSDTKTAMGILKKLKSLKGNEEENEDYFLRKIDDKTTKDYLEFLEVLNGTKVVLGV